LLSHEVHDIDLVKYSTAGELLQIKYASAGIRRGRPVVGWTDDYCKNGFIIMASKRPSPLQYHMEKNLCVLENELVICSTGYLPDCQYLMKVCSDVYYSHKMKYGVPTNLYNFGRRVASSLTEGLFTDDDENREKLNRPLAVHVIASKLENGRVKLIRIENVGVHHECSIAFSGCVSEDVRDKVIQLLHQPKQPINSTCYAVAKEVCEGYSDAMNIDMEEIQVELIILKEGGIRHNAFDCIEKFHFDLTKM
jgi:20S proteasome alpha/beta subunit